MKKRIVSLLLSSLMVIGLCACGGDSQSATSDGAEASSTEEISENASSEDISSEDTSEDLTGESEVEPSETYQKLSEVDSLLNRRGVLPQGANSDYVPLNYDKMKAMWISQFDMEDIFCTETAGVKTQRSKAAFRQYLSRILDNVKNLGFNTVIVQIRPNADSFYPSEYYPWSHFINGSYGKFSSYDPLEIFIEEAHERDLSFHAWINPMRGMSVEAAKTLDSNYPMAKWIKRATLNPNSRYARYLYVGTYDNKPSYYLNVYYEEVRQLIIDGAAEIVRYYDVDGVHMDDYFYPGNDSAMDDKELAEEKQNNALMDLRTLRYDSLNKLVAGIYAAVKAENPNVIYGIAPAGNINNVRNTHYADVDTWCGNSGYIDYIMPQIYWGFEHSICPFAETYQLWASLCCDDVDFMVGLTFANAIYGYEGIYYDEFINNKNIYKKTYEYMNAQPTFEGFSIFCYQYFYDPVKNTARIETEEELANATPAMAKIPSKKITY